MNNVEEDQNVDMTDLCMHGVHVGFNKCKAIRGELYNTITNCICKPCIQQDQIE